LTFSPDGKLLAAVHGGRTATLWDPKGGAPLHVLEDTAGEVTCLAFSPDGHQLAGGNRDGWIRLGKSAQPGRWRPSKSFQPTSHSAAKRIGLCSRLRGITTPLLAPASSSAGGTGTTCFRRRRWQGDFSGRTWLPGLSAEAERDLIDGLRNKPRCFRAFAESKVVRVSHRFLGNLTILLPTSDCRHHRAAPSF
jgi:WD40 repeat protein